MASYPNSGNVAFTGFTPTLGSSSVTPDASGGNVFANGLTQQDAAIARILFTGNNRVIRRLLNVTIGAAAGDSTVESRTFITAFQMSGVADAQQGGGTRPIAAVDLINRVSTATDVTNLKAMINRSPVPTYVADASGIGGGGHAGW